MKYLLIIKARTLPPPEALRRHKEWVLEGQRRGRSDFAYCFAAQIGGVTIVNADNPDEINDAHFEAPLGPYCDIEIYPLVDFAKQMDRLADLQKS